MTSTRRRLPKFDTVSAPISELPQRAMIAARQKELSAAPGTSTPSPSRLSPLPAADSKQAVTEASPSTSAPAPRTGPELIDQMIQFPTLDVVLDRDPHARPYMDQELEHLVQGERSRRALYQTKLDKAASKRQGLTEPEKVEEPSDE